MSPQTGSLRYRTWVITLCLLALPLGLFAQSGVDSFQKNFRKFAGLAPNVDFYGSDRQLVAAYEKPVAETMARLKSLLGDRLPAGALVVCKSAAERDSVAEERVLKLGYKWALVQMSPQAEMDQALEQARARLGDQLTPEMLARFQPPPEQMAGMLAQRAQMVLPRISYAVVSTLLAPDKEFRTSRLDDMSRSPLADWIDIGVSRYAANTSANSLRWTQERIDEIYPLDDLIQMNRPFVAPEQAGGGGGGMNLRMMGGMPGGGGGGAPGGGRQEIVIGGLPACGGMPGGGMPGGGGQRGGGQMPKEMQDRNNFDNQAALLFAYVVDKLGEEKARTLVEKNIAGEDLESFLEGPEFFGKRLSEVEREWVAWVKAQQAPQQQPFRMGGPEGRPGRPPERP